MGHAEAYCRGERDKEEDKGTGAGEGGEEGGKSMIGSPPCVAIVTFHLHYLHYSHSPLGHPAWTTFPSRYHAEITCWQSNQWERTQVGKCHLCPLRVGGFLFMPSSWKESVIQTNSEVSRNYRLVSTDFHQQLCMLWSGRNVNESSIGVNQLQAPQWPPQHSPMVLCAAVKCTLQRCAFYDGASGQ